MTTNPPPSAGIGIPRALVGGACTNLDIDLFFPEADDRTHNAQCYAAAKAICARCPIIRDCLMGALERGETWGVWGGTDPMERWKLRRQLART